MSMVCSRRENSKKKGTYDFKLVVKVGETKEYLTSRIPRKREEENYWLKA